MSDDEYTNWVELVGFIGGLIISVMMIPQVWKVYQTKSSQDLSWGFLACYVVGQTMLIVYSFAKNLWALYVPLCFENFMLLAQVFMKYYYDEYYSAKKEISGKETKDHKPHPEIVDVV